MEVSWARLPLSQSMTQHTCTDAAAPVPLLAHAGFSFNLSLNLTKQIQLGNVFLSPLDFRKLLPSVCSSSVNLQPRREPVAPLAASWVCGGADPRERHFSDTSWSGGVRQRIIGFLLLSFPPETRAEPICRGPGGAGWGHTPALISSA